MKPISCRNSHVLSDVHCRLCGQGFAVDFHRESAEARTRTQRRIESYLWRQHLLGSPTHPHGRDGFSMPAEFAAAM